jgi:hypothetical protein
MLAYLGATAEQIADFDSSHRRWGKGTVRITLLAGRRNLLRLPRVKCLSRALSSEWRSGFRCGLFRVWPNFRVAGDTLRTPLERHVG